MLWAVVAADGADCCGAFANAFHRDTGIAVVAEHIVPKHAITLECEIVLLIQRFAIDISIPKLRSKFKVSNVKMKFQR